MDKAYKFAHYIRREGVVSTLKRTRRYVAKKTRHHKQKLDIMASVADVVAADFTGKPYVRPKGKKADKLKIAWILSPLSAGSGGQNTIVRFARSLQEKGHDVTFYIYESIQPQSVPEARKILSKHFSASIPVRKLARYEESDALIATGWETAYPVFNLKTRAHKFYFVQDFEPLFYGMGSKAILAENTYRMNFYGITAGKWLSRKVSRDFGMEADHFNFGADLDIYKHAEETKKKKRVVFYARPVTERRAFELGVLALDIFHKQHPDYEIHFIGWDTSNYAIPFPYVNRGILSHDDLAALYGESPVGLVLSLTNVSLLPLELLAAGCIPVMNDGENNRVVLGHKEFIHYAVPAPVDLARELSRVVAMKDVNDYCARASASVSDLSWESSYRKVETILLREVAR